MSPLRPAPSLVPGGLIRLFDGSSLVGLTDGELLARFVATRDEVAFEGLVVRLGPMVLGVARRMLGDRADADDAFQATFLVLVRRAGSVGRGDLIGPWLHGVAVRVCRKARAQAIRRQTREQTGLTVDLLPPGSALALASPLDGAETRALIDAEIARLPASSRRLVVLCDVEGLTRDEAADRLGWTPNMVRGRLARARAQLRTNLTRRGCLPPGWASASSTEASGLVALSGLFVPPAPLVAATARAALASLTPPGRAAVAATGLATTSALHLAEGVIRAMFLTSGKFVATSVLAAGTLAAGTAGVLLAQGPAPAHPAVAGQPETAARPSFAALPPADASLKTLLEERFRLAHQRYQAKNTLYEEGRITIDRLITAARQVMEAELPLAETPEKRRLSLQTYVDRVQLILQKETLELEAGRATTDDIALATDALVEARILLAQTPGSAPVEPLSGPNRNPAGQVSAEARATTDRRGDGPPTPPQAVPAASSPQVAELNQARVALARKLFAAAERFYPSEVSAADYVAELRTLLEAELAAAPTPVERAQVFEKMIRAHQLVVNAAEDLASRGQKKPTDVMRVQLGLLELQTRAASDGKVDRSQATTDLDRRLTEVEAKVDRVLDLLNSSPDRPRVKR